MSYDEILGACVSDYWQAKDAQAWIDELLRKGVIVRLDTGRYDAMLEYREYERYLNRRKLYRHFHPEFPQDAPLGFSSCFDPGSEAEYTIRACNKILGKRK